MGTAFAISEVSHVDGWVMPLRMVPSVRTKVEYRLDNDRLCALIEAVAAVRDRKAFAELFTYLAPRLQAFGLRQGARSAARFKFPSDCSSHERRTRRPATAAMTAVPSILSVSGS